jgi:hypothetical protein
MSRNWVIPVSARNPTVLKRQARFSLAASRTSGATVRISSAAARSAAKLSFPPR